MRKTRMISVIAASLLTATVVFTGCGGGGSSATTQASSASSASSVSSSASSQSSTTTSGGAASSQCLPGQDCESTSSSTAAVKKVIVSDGYVLGATVKCKTGKNEPTAVATANPGEYEFNVAQCPAKLCAKDGVIDVNDNNKIDAGEPKAPKMTAPGSYTNINPYTTLIANGMTPAEVAEAFGLDANTDFDTPVPESTDATFVKNAVLLSAMLSYIESCSSTRGILPTPESGAAPSSTSTQPSSSSAANSSAGNVPCSMAELVQALKSGKSIEDLLPPELEELPGKLSNATPDKADDVAAPFIAKFNGAHGESVSSSAGASEGDVLPVPGDTTQTVTEEHEGGHTGGEVSGGEGQEGTSSSEATSSSEETTSSSETNTSSSETTSSSEECEPVPGSTCPSSSEATSSSEESSSSETGAFPTLEEEESSSSEATSSSEESSSSEATSSSEESSSSETGAFPTI